MHYGIVLYNFLRRASSVAALGQNEVPTTAMRCEYRNQTQRVRAMGHLVDDQMTNI